MGQTHGGCYISKWEGLSRTSPICAGRQLICISDRSFKHKKASHAWIITDIHEEYSFRGAGPVPGDPDTLSAYWAELQDHWLSWYASTHCLNYMTCEGAANKLCTLAYDPDILMVHPDNTDSDILLAIQEELKAKQFILEMKWIPSHMDDHRSVNSLPLMEHLNIWCNSRAKHQPTLHRVWVSDFTHTNL